jgi:integrase
LTEKDLNVWLIKNTMKDIMQDTKGIKKDMMINSPINSGEITSTVAPSVSTSVATNEILNRILAEINKKPGKNENLNPSLNTISDNISNETIDKILNFGRGVMGREYGFNLTRHEKKGRIYFEVRYKEGNTWINTRSRINTSDIKAALNTAIKEKDNFIERYYARKTERANNFDKTDLYRMLNNYYTPDSVYLQRDNNDNRPSLSPLKIRNLRNITKKHLIPFLQSKKIRTINSITKTIYSDYKIYLQNKNFSAGYINTVLSSFNRILLHNERYEHISKLPYSKGMGRVVKSKEEEERVKGNCLPFNKMRGIARLCYNMSRRYKSVFKSKEILLLFSLGLTTGLRDKEISNIKIKDIKYAEKGKMYLLYVNNHKIERYTIATEKYRKIPLHPYIVQQLKEYIAARNKKSDDYLFEYDTTRQDRLKMRMKIRLGDKYREEDFDNNREKLLNYNKALNSITYLFIAINIREKIIKSEKPRLTDKIKESIMFSKEDIKKIIEYTKEHNYHFYSFRHTLTTIMGLDRLNTDFIDYITGHLPEGKMRANYTHINSVDNALFCKEYGALFLKTIDKYFFVEPKEDREKAGKEAIKNFIEKNKGINREKEIENNSLFEVV